MKPLIRQSGPPLLVLVLLLLLWQAAVTLGDIPKFLLPSPGDVALSLWGDGVSLALAGLETLRITLIALALAVLSGVALALMFTLSPALERALSPYAVILQVTPIVSVAPLIIIWVGIDHVNRALVIIAWLAAFFPILTNMRAGLKSVDPVLADVFTVYGATRWQRFWRLIWPSAMPFLLAGVKVSAGLALIGAVVAEFVAGSGGAAGLAWRILEAGNRLQMPKMFAGLVLLAVIGVILFYIFAALERAILGRWYGQGGH